MTRTFLFGLVLVTACAPATFHAGRTSLSKPEQVVLSPRPRAPRSAFARFWRSPGLRDIGLIRWNDDRSWSCPAVPADLLREIRDQLGRLNRDARKGEDLSLAVTVYRFERGGILRRPTAYYELVARDAAGRVAWAADDKIEARPELAETLADTPSSIIAREMLRRTRLVLHR